MRLDVFFPGFPTLKHIPHTARFKEAGVRVFEQTSRGVNALLVLEDQGHPPINEVADQLLGQEIWVSWPHMVEAKVTAVSDARTRIGLDPENGRVRREESNGEEFKLQAGIKILQCHLKIRGKITWCLIHEDESVESSGALSFLRPNSGAFKDMPFPKGPRISIQNGQSHFQEAQQNELGL